MCMNICMYVRVCVCVGGACMCLCVVNYLHTVITHSFHDHGVHYRTICEQETEKRRKGKLPKEVE